MALTFYRMYIRERSLSAAKQVRACRASDCGWEDPEACHAGLVILTARHDPLIVAGMDVAGCLGCDLAAGRLRSPGGILYETPSWLVNHVVGAMNLGTLIAAPREHIVAVAHLDGAAAAELGPVLRTAACVVEALCEPEQTYVCLWSHGPDARKHLHFAIQPVTAAVLARYGGLRAEQLQARMLVSGDRPDAAEVERFCERARELFGVVALPGDGARSE